MDYVVDFQGFKDDCNNFIIKELCIQAIENKKPVGVVEQYLFQPPFNFKHLSEQKKKQVRWLKEYHGFSWTCGLQDYEELESIMNRLSKGRYIYVKGSEKLSYLQREMINSYVKIIDIYTVTCPSLNVLKQQITFPYSCPYAHKSKHCAANNVYLLTNWLLNNICKDCK